MFVIVISLILLLLNRGALNPSQDGEILTSHVEDNAALKLTGM